MLRAAPFCRMVKELCNLSPVHVMIVSPMFLMSECFREVFYFYQPPLNVIKCKPLIISGILCVSVHNFYYDGIVYYISNSLSIFPLCTLIFLATSHFVTTLPYSGAKVKIYNNSYMFSECQRVVCRVIWC